MAGGCPSGKRKFKLPVGEHTWIDPSEICRSCGVLAAKHQGPIANECPNGKGLFTHLEDSFWKDPNGKCVNCNLPLKKHFGAIYECPDGKGRFAPSDRATLMTTAEAFNKMNQTMKNFGKTMRQGHMEESMNAFRKIIKCQLCSRHLVVGFALGCIVGGIGGFLLTMLIHVI